MNKNKRILEIGFRERLLQAKPFDHSIFSSPRDFTRHMSSIVRYPKLINDIGRTVDVSRAGDNRFAFELRQKRYLGRGNYAISARAKGFISYDETSRQTRITGFVKLGGQYVTLLNVMTLFVLLSTGLIFVTILYLPLFLLMSAVIGLHWMYLFADRRDLQEQLDYLVDVTEREARLRDHEIDYQTSQNEVLSEQVLLKRIDSH